MNTWFQAMCVAALMTSAAFAEKPADVSLSNEVDQYLEKASSEVWQEDNTMRGFFKEGLKFESMDGNFQMEIFGRLMFDLTWAHSDDYGPSATVDTQNFRRVRLGVAGKVYKRFAFKVQIDFATGVSVLRDVWGAIQKIPVVGEFKFGNFHEPFGLQEITSSKYIQLIERSTVMSCFAPSRHSGVGVANTFLEGKLGVQVFYGRTSNGQGFAAVDGGGVITARITGMVMENTDENMFVHIGAAVSHRDDSAFRARARPGTGTNDRLVDTGSITINNVLLYAFELASRWQSLSFAAEFMMADLDAAASGDPSFSGWYVEVGYFVTGEVRAFKGGKWGRTKPKKNLSDGGMGAIQVVVRYDTVDLNDASIAGGEMDTIIVGVNWHWNPNMRMMMNIIFADVTGGPNGTGEFTAFSIRFQVDF